MAIVCSPSHSFAQAGEKYATGANNLTDNDKLGSKNYAGLNFYTNSIKRGSFTKDGTLDILGESRFRKKAFFDSLLTAFAIRVQTIQANSLTVIYNAQIDGLLTVGNTLNFDGTNQTISSTTGIINFSNNTLTTTGKITADTINANYAAINNNLSALNITATGIQTQTINTGELLINGQPPQIGDTINVNVVNAGNIVIDGPASQIYSTNGVIDFNNNNIKNVGKLTVSQLGINTPNPIASMQVSGTDELNTTIGLIRYSDDDRSSRLSFVKYRGTMANPKSVLSGDRLGIISYHGFDGVQFQSSDMIKGVATENFNPTGRGSKIEFSTTPNGSTTDQIALILDNDQTARFANTVYAPNIVISDKIITKEAEFDSLRINEKIYATGSLSTDTVHANKELTINNSLKITKEDINNYAEVSTKDTAVTLVLQKEEAAEVIIGRKDSVALPQPGQEKDKLTVVGNTRLQGDVNVSGAITANDLSITNTFSTQRIVTTRITSPDSIIAFGDSSIYFDYENNRIYNSPGGFYGGLGIGFDAYAKGTMSLALGAHTRSEGYFSVSIGSYCNVASNATKSIVIGSGISGSLFTNTVSNSLMIGFNSNLPTLVVTEASGLNTTGNVGIGTTNPHSKLEVNGDIRINNYDLKLRTSDVDGHHGLGWYGEANFVDKKFAGVNVNGPVLYGYSGGALGSRQGFPPDPYIDNIALVWKSDGNVGIGTTSPNYKLDVCGTIRAKEIIVNETWCDYVFKEDYKLMNLTDLEIFVKKYKHLPEVPPEQEIIENGLSLGEMQKTQMKKIEELTLYIFELNKRIQELENK